MLFSVDAIKKLHEARIYVVVHNGINHVCTEKEYNEYYDKGKTPREVDYADLTSLIKILAENRGELPRFWKG